MVPDSDPIATDWRSRPASRARAPRRHWLLLATLLVSSLLDAPARAQTSGPIGTVTEVKILGNKSIATEDIQAKIQTRAGRDYDSRLIESDVTRLLATKWFSEVRPFYKKDPERGGLIVTFRVSELPVLREVEFRGMTKLKRKEVEESTGLKPGARADEIKNQLAAQQIRRMYEDKGFMWADVRLIEGGKAGDTRAVFEIFEGPKCKVGSIRFTGNSYVTGGVLRSKIGTRAAILGLGGTYHRDDIDDDARKLREYYQNQGFFEVKVRPVVRPDPNMGDMNVEFVISEGIQFKVRDIEFEGNSQITEEALREGLVLHSGQPFKNDLREADLKSIQTKYGTIGCIDAQVIIERRYADPEKSPGVLDLVYKIDEGVPYRLGRLIVKGNDRTLDAVIRREANMAGLVPGEPLDVQRIDNFRKRLGNLRYFAMTPDQGKPVDVQLANRRPADQPFGAVNPLVDLNEVVRTRLQNDGFDEMPGVERLDPEGKVTSSHDNDDTAPRDGAARVAQADGPGSGVFAPPIDDPLPPLEAPPPELLPGPIQPGVGPGAGTRTPPLGSDVPPGLFPSMPGGNMTDVGPDRQEPFPERSFADIITQVDEVATGRLMFGVGASSFGGLSGNFILHETNFDILAFPRSLSDFGNGRAFRGRGQDFRIELSPGTSINRAVISFRDPYVFNLPIGFGTSGYVFSRFYPDWTEDRGGGRFSLGRQFGTQTYADVAFRIEDVDVHGFSYPAPAEYLAVSGHTTLATIRPSLRFDNRNDAFSPNRGSYLEFAFEQGWGDFTYPKVSVEGRTHFTLGSRADGSGKRTLTLRGFYGATGQDTPLYEKWFAGDFRSMRGFAYRGVGPRVLGLNIGGLSTLIGSVEYQFPWTANDRFQQVIFTDFGTVENSYQIENFRVAVGTGLRVYLPPQMFGPLPLAFDIAFPVVKGPDDRERIFTFFIGAFW
jgi:outer membrane protein insertion porin family